MANQTVSLLKFFFVAVVLFATGASTSAQSLEISEDFRIQAAAAWKAVSNGGNPYAECGFSVYKDGGASSLHTEIHPITSGMAQQWRDKISFGVDDLAIFHTHPNSSLDKPSQNDVAAAKKIGKVIYVSSRTGLWKVDASGKVTQIFTDPEWATKK